MDKVSPAVGHGAGSSSRGAGASSTASPILHVKATKPQLHWQQQLKRKAAAVAGPGASSVEASSGPGPAVDNPMNKHEQHASSNNRNNAPGSKQQQTSSHKSSSNSGHASFSTHKIKHHDHKHKHHKHRSAGLGSVKSCASTSGSISLGKHRHKKHQHHKPSSGVQRYEFTQKPRMEAKPKEQNTVSSNKLQSISSAQADHRSESGSTGVFRAARELAQLRADLAEIGVDPGAEEGGSNPCTPSGRKGSGRGRGRQPAQYEEVTSWVDEESGVTYTKGGELQSRLDGVQPAGAPRRICIEITRGPFICSKLNLLGNSLVKRMAKTGEYLINSPGACGSLMSAKAARVVNGGL